MLILQDMQVDRCELENSDCLPPTYADIKFINNSEAQFT